MLKMGLPLEAVKHAMTRDEKDPAIMDLDPEKSLKSQQNSAQDDDGPPLREDPDYVKYWKMLAMGLPGTSGKIVFAHVDCTLILSFPFPLQLVQSRMLYNGMVKTRRSLILILIRALNRRVVALSRIKTMGLHYAKTPSSPR